MHYALLNGQLVPLHDAHIPIQDRGFRYGDGLFETLAVQGGVPYRFEWHMSRLAAGLKAIRIAADTAPLHGYARHLLAENQITDALLRIHITRGPGGRGYLPDPNAPPTLVMETLPTPQIPFKPGSLWQSSYTRPAATALPTRYKLSQGLNSTLARLEAADHACLDALMLNERGQLCEASSANLFWRTGDTLYTPALSSGALEGSTRDALLRIAPCPVQEAEATIDALLAAEAVALTNTVWQALPINALLPQGKTWDSLPLARQLRQWIADDRASYVNTHRAEWK